MTLPTTPQELAHVLAMLSEPDTNTVKQASAVMKDFMQNPESVSGLMQQIQESSVIQGRQMAAVLLRRKIAAHWQKLPRELQEGIKKTLLRRLVEEQSNLVRMSIAALISILAEKLIKDDGELWGELLEFLLKCSESQDFNHREVAMILFRALAENIGQALKPHFPTLQGIFVRGLADPHDVVKIEALRALSVLVEYLDSDHEVENFKNVVFPMVESVKYFVQKDDEEAAAVAFEAFDNLAESGAPVLFDHLPVLVPLMCEVMLKKNIDIKIRDKASLFMSSLIENKPGKIVKHDFVPHLLNTCFQLLVEVVEDPEAEITSEKIGVEVLDALANHTPKMVVWNTSMAHVSALLADSSSVKRRAGLMIIAALAEGLAELMADDLPQLVNVACNGVQDRDAIVRNAAVEAIIMMADHLQPDILDHHQQIIPAMFALLDNTTEKTSVKKRVCIALDAFCSEMTADVLHPYVDGILKRMTTLLRTAETEIQQTAISAIKSCAAAAKGAFTPYFPDLVNMMGQLMSQTDDKVLDLRAEATECMGAMMAAVGKQTAGPLVDDIVKLVGAGFDLDYFHLRESSYHFFGSIAKMLEADFEPYLFTVMTYLVAACTSDEGLNLKKSGALMDNYDCYDDDEQAEEEDVDISDARYTISIRSGAIEEKLAALHCIGEICECIGKLVAPYLPKVIGAMVQLAVYPYPQVRQATMGVTRDIVSLLALQYPPAEECKAGHVTPLHPEVEKAFFGDDPLMDIIIEEMMDEDDKQAVALACESMFEAMKRFGLAVIQPKIDDVYKAMIMLVEESAPCQQNYDQDDPEAADHDHILIDSVTDVVGMVAQVVGPTFEPIFQSMFPSIAKFVQPHRAESDRSMAIGCFAEVCEAIGERATSFFEQLLPIVFTGLKDESIQVRRNSCFCLGVLVEIGGAKLFGMHQEFLKLLAPSLQIPDGIKKKNMDSALACKENACSAICKMITVNSAGLPVAQLLPEILKCCPLTSDLSECKSVYNCLMYLFQADTASMASFLPDIVTTFAAALHNADVDETLRMNIAGFCKSLQQSQQLWAVVQQTLGMLTPELREAFGQSIAALG